MDKLNKITVPASQKLRQLQKMVHDIKNNEGGIMDKIKKLKVKGPPSVPRRDYALDSPADEEEQWSDDFVSVCSWDQEGTSLSRRPLQWLLSEPHSEG